VKLQHCVVSLDRFEEFRQGKKEIEEQEVNEKIVDDANRELVYEIDEEQFVAQEGITELIDMTYELIPEGMQAARKDIEAFKLNRKKVICTNFNCYFYAKCSGNSGNSYSAFRCGLVNTFGKR